MSKNFPYASIQNALVLFVEPSEEIRKAVAGAFQNTGLRLIAASNGRDTLALIRTFGLPALAIIEISLPDMSGFELAVRLKRQKDVPIIRTGNLANPNQTVSMLDLIAEDFIKKPTDEREIVARSLLLLLGRSLGDKQTKDNFSNDQLRWHFAKKAQKTIH